MNPHKVILTIVAVIGAILLLWTLSPFRIVPPAHRGVVTTFGKPSPEILGEGLHWRTPLAQSVHLIDVSIKNEQVTSEAASKDLTALEKLIEEKEKCPFCGWNGQHSPRPTQWENGTWQVQCGSCGANSPVELTKDNAYESWGVRPREDKLAEVCKALMKALDRVSWQNQGTPVDWFNDYAKQALTRANEIAKGGTDAH